MRNAFEPLSNADARRRSGNRASRLQSRHRTISESKKAPEAFAWGPRFSKMRAGVIVDALRLAGVDLRGLSIPRGSGKIPIRQETSMAKKKPVKKSASSKSHLKQVKLKSIKPLDVTASGHEKWIEVNT